MDLIPIYFSCVRSAINVKENKRIADELISQANSYWNQRTDAKALDKAENLILKVLEKKPYQLEHVVLLAKIKFTRAYFQVPNPGTTMERYNDFSKEITDKKSEAFSVIDVDIVKIDWLYLKREGHRRANIFVKESAKDTWVSP